MNGSLSVLRHGVMMSFYQEFRHKGILPGMADLGMISVHGVGVGHRAARAIRTGQLRALPRLHIRPINVLVWHGPMGRSGFEVAGLVGVFEVTMLDRKS
jgi:hypothetical protein